MVTHRLSGHENQGPISQQPKNERYFILFYAPNHCYLSNRFAGSQREFKLKGSFPQNYPQSSAKVSLLSRWLISRFGTNLINIIPPVVVCSARVKLRIVSIFSLQRIDSKRRKYVLCPLSTLWSRPIKLLALSRSCGTRTRQSPPIVLVLLLFKVQPQTGRCLKRDVFKRKKQRKFLLCRPCWLFRLITPGRFKDYMGLTRI